MKVTAVCNNIIEPESPRVTSTYLYKKEKNVEPSNGARVRTKAILPVDPHLC